MTSRYTTTFVGLGTALGLVAYFLGTFGVLLVVLIVLASIPWIVSIRKGDVDVFEPINFASIFMFVTAYEFFYRLYVSERALSYPELISRSFDEGMFLVMLLYVILYSSVLLGYYLKFDWYERLIPKFPAEGKDHLEILKLAAVLYVVVGLLFYVLLIQESLHGNPLHLFTTSDPRSEVFEGAYHIQLGAQMLHIGYFLWIVRTISKGVTPGVIQLSLFAPVFVAFLLLGGRGTALNLVLILMVLLYYTWIKDLYDVRRRHITFFSDQFHAKVKILSIPVIGFFLVVSAAYLRYLRFGWSISKVHEEVDLLGTFAIDEGRFDRLLLLLEYSPGEIGYYYGLYYLRPLLNFIPRAYWEEKPPLTVGSELRETVFPTASGGLPPSIIGEFYVNFGYPGILVGGVVTGISLRVLYEIWSRNTGSVLILYIYSLIVVRVAVEPGFSNNILFTVISTLLLLTPVFFVIFVSHSHRRSTDINLP